MLRVRKAQTFPLETDQRRSVVAAFPCDLSFPASAGAGRREEVVAEGGQWGKLQLGPRERGRGRAVTSLVEEKLESRDISEGGSLFLNLKHWLFLVIYMHKGLRGMGM